jgi:hypothetical protein
MDANGWNWGDQALVPLSIEGRPNFPRKCSLFIRADCRVARVGPTTRARRLADASVDPIEARRRNDEAQRPAHAERDAEARLTYIRVAGPLPRLVRHQSCSAF